MKTMTIDELKKRGLQQGDLYFSQHDSEDFTGWYLVIGNAGVSLNTNLRGAWSGLNVEAESHKKTKVILTEGLQRSSYPNVIAEFFKTFDESLVENLITKIIHKPLSKYVHAVHFGSSKIYTWRVPEGLNRVDFKVGDIIEVDTMHGKQYVQVKETAEYEYDEKTKEVLALIKAKELPF